jgi:kynurenine 3-monooxygenase
VRPQAINIVGAGLAGSLLALSLARRGFRVTVWERRDDPRTAVTQTGRSINLALAERGLSALTRCGVIDEVRPLLTAMRGRLVHEPGQPLTLLPYGIRTTEVIWSVSRSALNRVLIDAATRAGALLRFGHACVGIDLDANTLSFKDAATGRSHATDLIPTVAADGAGSFVRGALARAGVTDVEIERLDHDYKELCIPPRQGRFALESHGLHLWPRGGFMLIALPNIDRSFTATLFLARDGNPSFAQLTSVETIESFFAAHFPEVGPLIPDRADQFMKNPQGTLSTVHASKWYVADKIVLLGDAAHAIVPFHGQGMNAAFEDCALFDELLDTHQDWQSHFREFERVRRPNANAIARMAIENYQEMRHAVLDPRFRRMKEVSLLLERLFPNRFISRYSMVSFHAEIPYEEALARGEIQQDILEELDAHRLSTGEIDASLAARLVATRLPALRQDT